MATNNVTIKVGAVDNTGSVFQQVQKKVDELKKQFGSNSLGKSLVDSAIGGGAFAGISFIGNTFADTSKRIAEMAQEMRRGKATTADFVSEFARSAPVLGGFVRGMDSIVNTVTGARAELDKLNESIERTNKQTNDMVKRAAAFRGARGAVADLRDFNDARPGRVGAPPVPQLGQIIRELGTRLQASGQRTGGSLQSALGYNPFQSLDSMSRLRADVERYANSLRALGQRPADVGPSDPGFARGFGETSRTYEDRLARLREQRAKEQEGYDIRRTPLLIGSSISARNAQLARPIIDELFAEQIRSIRDGAKDVAEAIAGPSGFVGVLRATFPGLSAFASGFNRSGTLPNSPYLNGGPGFGFDPTTGGPLTDAISGSAGIQRQAAGGLADVLQGRLEAIRSNRRSAYAGRFASSISGRGMSGIESVGASSLMGPSSEERKLEEQIKGLREDSKEQTEVMKQIAAAVVETARRLSIRPPDSTEASIFN